MSVDLLKRSYHSLNQHFKLNFCYIQIKLLLTMEWEPVFDGLKTIYVICNHVTLTLVQYLLGAHKIQVLTLFWRESLHHREVDLRQHLNKLIDKVIAYILYLYQNVRRLPHQNWDKTHLKNFKVYPSCYFYFVIQNFLYYILLLLFLAQLLPHMMENYLDYIWNNNIVSIEINFSQVL